MYRHQGQWRSQFPCYNIVTIPIWMLEFIHENLSKASPQWTCLTSSPPYNLKSYPLWMVKFSRHITSCKVQGWTAVILVEMVQDILAKCMCFWKTKFETQIKWTIFLKKMNKQAKYHEINQMSVKKRKGVTFCLEHPPAWEVVCSWEVLSYEQRGSMRWAMRGNLWVVSHCKMLHKINK